MRCHLSRGAWDGMVRMIVITERGGAGLLLYRVSKVGMHFRQSDIRFRYMFWISLYQILRQSYFFI